MTTKFKQLKHLMMAKEMDGDKVKLVEFYNCLNGTKIKLERVDKEEYRVLMYRIPEGWTNVAVMYLDEPELFNTYLKIFMEQES